MQEQFMTDEMTTAASTISLVNVVRFYEPTRYLHQRNALDWLQHRSPEAPLVGFVQRWNNPFGERLPMLIEGDRNQAVAELQMALNRWGIRVVVDGDFGRFTKAAVIRFQQQRNLRADGIVGNKTWGELFKSAGTIRFAELFNQQDELTAQKTAALQWLQSQLSRSLLTEFAQRWRNQIQ
ncbi:peptidoglycan-binding domain-containing protein [Microcoleus sp. FACHB-1515]